MSRSSSPCRRLAVREAVPLSILLYASLIATLMVYRLARTEQEMTAYIAAICLVLLTSLVLWSDSTTRRLALRSASRSPYFLLYSIFVVVSQFVSTVELGLSPTILIWGVGYSVIGLVSYFVFAAALASHFLRQWMILLVVVGVFSATVGLYVGLTGANSLFGIPISRQLKMGGPFGFYVTSSILQEANRYALVVFFGIVGLAYFIGWRSPSPFYLIALLVSAAGILVSWSRAVYLALYVGALTWMLTRGRRQRGPGCAFRLALVALCAAPAALVLEPIRYIIFGQGWARRDTLWLAAIELVKLRPVWGYGLGRVHEAMYGYLGAPEAVHSGPLGLMLQSGIPAGVVWLWTVVASVLRLVRAGLRRPLKATILMAVAGSIIAAIVLDYNLGGIGYGSFVQTVFLGLGNMAPMLTEGNPPYDGSRRVPERSTGGRD